MASNRRFQSLIALQLVLLASACALPVEAPSPAAPAKDTASATAAPAAAPTLGTTAAAARTEPSVRFVVSADAKTVRDTDTGLVWQRSTSPVGVTWEGAFDYCRSLEIAGFEGEWHLPDIASLGSLFVESVKPSDLPFDTAAFPDTPPEFFWSSSANDEFVGTVFFNSRSFPTGLGPEKSLGNVRCVSGELRPGYEVPEFASYYVYTIPRSVAR